MKLLEKTAEARYQSAVGLKTDLKTCLERLQKTGKIESFPLAQYDFTGQLLIPQKLYGREREVDALSEAFNRVTEGRTELMLVAGYSGVGKSVLVQELYKPLVQQRGYFIWGKFDQFKRNVPYSALIQAFRDLVRQLLTESEEAIATWKEKLQANLGPNGAVIIDVIPEVELLVGKQPEVPHLGPSESQNRFNLVFQKFVSVFTRIEHPLVLFLDDLQWADSASLKLLQLLLVNARKQAFLLIGAYRDNEVVSAHALTQTLQVIQTSATRINQLQLQPLSLHCISQLLADSLHCLPTSIQSLAKLLLEKTDGNPFFLT
ncbi:ATP-binding protein [Phormidium sp. CCY1219]|uniref:ATP-binding protein n=1 Tax=Phormidium sp. CCY1219 TaxID=2886104 RepID=UPI002D7881CB|nr:AAA family ATPase [Phormidium sp. CCY1219]